MIKRPVTIIANCQAWPLAQIMAQIGEGVTCRFISLNDISLKDSLSYKSTLGIIADSSHSDELVFSFNASPQFAPADTNSLRKIFGMRLRTFTNIRFDGLHPDCTYFGRFGGRLLGTMGEYHSKIIIYSFASGRTERDCHDLFNYDTYLKLGYFDIWATSENVLHSRDGECDIRLANMFIDVCKNEYSMFTFNHPTSAVMHDVAAALCRDADITVQTLGRHHFPNNLFHHHVWPIYPELIRHFRLPYESSMVFYRPAEGVDDIFKPRSLRLNDLIKADYENYGSILREEFIAGARELDFYKAFEMALG